MSKKQYEERIVHAATVFLTERDLCAMLQVPDDTHIVSVYADSSRRAIGMILEGPTLPLCHEGEIPQTIEAIKSPIPLDGTDSVAISLRWDFPQ